MHLITLPVGAMPDPEDDSIRIEQQADGRYRLMGRAISAGECRSVDDLLFPSQSEAEFVGLAWAERLGVRELHVARASLGATAPAMDLAA